MIWIRINIFLMRMLKNRFLLKKHEVDFTIVPDRPLHLKLLAQECQKVCKVTLMTMMRTLSNLNQGQIRTWRHTREYSSSKGNSTRRDHPVVGVAQLPTEKYEEETSHCARLIVCLQKWFIFVVLARGGLFHLACFPSVLSPQKFRSSLFRR